jgi:enoyl-CoA hydratase/carnithine racemase
MQTNLFNYTTIFTRLEKSTRTLFITLNRPDWNNAFRLEMLFELESILAWCTSRVEINTICINSSSAQFSSGHDLGSLSELTSSMLQKINTKLHKIIFSMLQLPQTIIMDLGEGTQTLASEFALGADIRIASQSTTVAFNHGLYGLTPGAGGMGLLTTLFTSARARSWVLSGESIHSEQLLASGFIKKTYGPEDREEILHQELQKIAQLAPVQRIQAKLGLFESIRPQIEMGLGSDLKIAKASSVSEDWRGHKYSQNLNSFMPAKSMSYSVKLSLIKTDETYSPEH